MRTKSIILVLFFMFVSTSIFSQKKYYYYKGAKKVINIDRKHVNIILKNDFVKSSISVLNIKDFEINNTNNSTEKWATIEFETEPNEMEYLQKINALKNNPNVECVAMHYKIGLNKSIGTSNLFYIKLKTATDEAFLREFAANKNAVVIKQDGANGLWFELKATKNSDTSVALTNLFFETGKFDSVDSGFMLDFEVDSILSTPISNFSPNAQCVSDGYFNEQWGLYNTINTNIDINACDAWTISEGDNIKVAVVDHGVWKQHPDFTGNISPYSFDTFSNTAPSVLNFVPNNSSQISSHGTHVAGIIAADRNNGNVAGIAPKSKIISISNPLNGFNINESSQLANGIERARIDGFADVINDSWFQDGGINYEPDLSGPYTSPLLESKITDAINLGRDKKGSVVVFAAGNEGSNSVSYPASSNDDILVVGAVNSSGARSYLSNYGDKLDLVAPGEGIVSTIYVPNVHSNNVASYTGTSMAAPFVSGTAALILKVNPCATAKQVRDYIESTCQKVGSYQYNLEPNRPNGTRNTEMGYGLLDSYAATKMAKEAYSPTFDLYIKDSYADSGKEPSTVNGIATNSPDIWVRNSDDNLDFHQTPFVKPSPNYVYVRVRNKSCIESPRITQSDFENLVLYMSFPSASGNTNTTESRSSYNPRENINYSLVGTQSIPALAAGEELILKFPFYPPIPWVPAGGHSVNINFLAKIIASTDPMAVAESSAVYNNVVKNNNIAAKNNIAISYDYLAGNGANNPERVAVGNPFNEPKIYRLELVKETDEKGKAIYDEAEISLKMDEILYAAWSRGGKQEINTTPTADEKKQIVEENHVLIDNIQLNANEVGFVELNFNFLAKEITGKTNFKYHIIQRDKTTNEIVGIETYDLTKKPRPVFEADAGENKEKDRNETITISAAQISEPAIYNWYDTDGNLIGTGKDLTVANDIAKKYKLEVIATADGFKDYSEVEIKLKPSVLSSIAPNPATDTITIDYKINEVGSAYLMVLGGFGTSTTSNNYIINPELGEININIANYENGFYTLALVVNGQIIDAKTLVKQ
jgi:serine protease